MPRLVKVVTLGCPKNVVDSEQITGFLLQEGYLPTDDVALADLIIVNTCGFIEDARRESIETILHLAQWKENGNCEYLIVAGCLAQKYARELARAIPEVDLFLGTGDIPVLPEILKSLQPGKSMIRVGDPDAFLFHTGIPRPPGVTRHYAYLKIAEGCDNCCSYCVIPSLRGSYRSRKMEEILEEASTLTKDGVKELILVAQDTTLYGKDLYGALMLPDLLKELVKIPGLYWLRLLYSYPSHLTDRLLETIGEEEKICTYLDLPLQHISDKILRVMGRGQGKEDTIRLLARIRSRLPDITLRSTFIVGFPGESREDFQELLSFLQDARFDRAGFFAYSREPGTRAASLPGQIKEKEKKRRLELATQIQNEIMAAKQAELVGKKVSVMVDGPSPDYEGLWEGRTRGDAPEIDGVVYFKPTETIKPGNILNISITHSHDFSLMGEIDNEPCQ